MTAPQPTLRPRPSTDALLRIAERRSGLTTVLVQAACGGVSSSYAQKRLYVLRDAGMLEATRVVRRRRMGRPALVYTLTAAGLDALRRAG